MMLMRGNMFVWTRTAIIFLVSGCAMVASSCTEDQHRSMQNEFSRCREKYNAQFHDSGGGSESLCRLVGQIVQECAKAWAICHNPTEILAIKNMHAEAFIKHWGSAHPSLQHCPALAQLRSGAVDGQGLGDQSNLVSCTDEESSDAMTKFQTCSHSTAKVIYSSVNELKDTNVILESLCEGLSRISSECPRLLTACSAPDDLKQIKEEHLREMTKFFYTLVPNGTIPDHSLDRCGQNNESSATSFPATTTSPPPPTSTSSITSTSTLVAATTKSIGIEGSMEETNDIEAFEAELEESEDDITTVKNVDSDTSSPLTGSGGSASAAAVPAVSLLTSTPAVSPASTTTPLPAEAATSAPESVLKLRVTKSTERSSGSVVGGPSNVVLFLSALTVILHQTLLRTHRPGRAHNTR